jgi:hypothetical protein
VHVVLSRFFPEGSGYKQTVESRRKRLKESVKVRLDQHGWQTEGEPVIEWSWDGNAEMDAAQGRGWAMFQGDELHGMIFFHGGDEAEFVAKRPEQKQRTKGK